jgi:DNA invertase Pin-like site-specific DNA recombinase
MLIGYARTSTTGQLYSVDAQERELKEAGCRRIFAEHVSATGKRGTFEEAMAFAREGDSLVVTRFDRLSRNVLEFLKLLDTLDKRGIGLRILDFANGDINPRSPTVRMFGTVMTTFSEFERDMMLTRQRDGIERAKKDGAYKGRAPTARRQTQDIMRLHREGMKPRVIATKLGISRASAYRIIAEEEKAALAAPRRRRPAPRTNAQ